jgi:AraC-like DNA-binding protein
LVSPGSNKVELPLPADLDGVVETYRADRDPAWVGARHRHDELELNLVTAGRATVLLDRRRYDLRPGTLLWLFPAQPHMVVASSAAFAMYVAVFRPRLVRRYCRDAPSRVLQRRRPAGWFCRLMDDADARRRLEGHLASLLVPGRPPDQLNVGMAWLLTEAWRCFETAADVPVGGEVDPAVERAARLLREDPGAWDVPALAEHVGASRWWLSRLFRRQMGASITDFRNRQRIERFARIVSERPALGLTGAAFAAGFHSYPQFYRVCRQCLGTTPRRYLRDGRAAPPR